MRLALAIGSFRTAWAICLKKKKKIKRKKEGIKERIKQDLNPEAQTLKKTLTPSASLASGAHGAFT